MIKYIIFIVVSMSGNDGYKFPICSHDGAYADVVVSAMKNGSYREQDVVNEITHSMQSAYPQAKITIVKEEDK